MSKEQKEKMTYRTIYKNNKPYGIRNENGFVFFFVDISKYTGQEERYREEIEEQYMLAVYLVNCLNQQYRPKIDVGEIVQICKDWYSPDFESLAEAIAEYINKGEDDDKRG